MRSDAISPSSAIGRSSTLRQVNAASRRAWLIGVFAMLAFGQTMAYYVYLRDDPGNYNGAGAQGDQVVYADLAQQILHGTWQGAVHYMPGLPAVIAASQLVFGDPRLGIAVVHGLLFALVVIYAARLASRAFGESAAPWAAGAIGLNPAIGYYAAQALTEFLTGLVLLLLVGTVARWSRTPTLGRALLAGLLIGAAGYLRAEYLALAVVFAGILVWLRGRRVLGQAAALIAVTALVIVPWVARNAVVTGQPALYNESPFSNLFLMGTWFRVFDEQTFAQLQQIETAPGSRDEAIARAGSVGPRPELSQRYMQQARGPYELPLGETLSLAAGNVQLNLRQYLVNHLVQAPILIWAGRTPVRQGDAAHLPSGMRYAVWAAELALFGLALWQAGRALRAGRFGRAKRGARRTDIQEAGSGNFDIWTMRHATGASDEKDIGLAQERGVEDAHAKGGQAAEWSNPSGQRRRDEMPTGRRRREGADEVQDDQPEMRYRYALALSFVAVVLFLTAVHIVIAVDERFTTPALPLVGLFAGSRLAELVRSRQTATVRFAT